MTVVYCIASYLLGILSCFTFLKWLPRFMLKDENEKIEAQQAEWKKEKAARRGTLDKNSIDPGELREAINRETNRKNGIKAVGTGGRFSIVTVCPSCLRENDTDMLDSKKVGYVFACFCGSYVHRVATNMWMAVTWSPEEDAAPDQAEAMRWLANVRERKEQAELSREKKRRQQVEEDMRRPMTDFLTSKKVDYMLRSKNAAKEASAPLVVKDEPAVAPLLPTEEATLWQRRAANIDVSDDEEA